MHHRRNTVRCCERAHAINRRFNS